MIAADTSSLISYFSGEGGKDVELVDQAFDLKHLVLPPVVLTELVSDPKLPNAFLEAIRQVPLLSLEEGYWERAGLLRAKILAQGLKVRIADALIAQVCVDTNVPLITRDRDFRHFSKSGLKVLPGLSA